MKKLLLFPDLKTSSALTATKDCTCSECIWEEGREFSDNEFDFSMLEFKMEIPGEEKLTEFSVTDLGAPIMSPRVKHIFEKFEINAQFYPVKIYNNIGTLISDEHFAMNLTNTIDCIDFDGSQLEVEEEEGEIVDLISIETIVLKDQFLDLIYRMYLMERVIVIEGDLVNRLEKEKISGMKLIQPQNWDGIAGEKTPRDNA